MPRKKIRFIFFTLTAFLILAVVSIYYFLFTTNGSGFIANQALSKYLPFEDIDVAKTSGNLSDSLIMEDIELTDWAGLPPGSVLKIERLKMGITGLSPEGLSVRIDNGRLRFPDLNTIFFYGGYANSTLDINAYCNQLYVKTLLDLFVESSILKNISGRINDLDVYIKGSLSEPALTGSLGIAELSKDGLLMVNCPVSFKITLQDWKENLKVFGEVAFAGGKISGPKTATIELQEGRILFSGNPQAPALALKGTAAVEDIKIYVALGGTFDKPDLQLSSEPALSQERLVLMLATGKSWRGTEMALGKGELSPELARDFVDYFFLGGSGNKIAKRFGIDDVAFKYDGQAKGIELKKTISDKLEATYGLEQSQNKDTKSTSTQKVGGSYKITDTVSVGAEKELKQEQPDSKEKPQTSDKVILKYKKEF